MARPITRSLNTREERSKKSVIRFDPSPDEDSLIKCKRIIGLFIRSDLKFYIGKTCENVGINGRHRDKYRYLNINNMKELARFNDENLAYSVEKELVKYYKGNDKFNCLNKVPGGSGGRAKNGPYIVYLAYE